MQYSTLLSGSLLLAAAALFTEEELILKQADHKRLSKDVAAYWQAKDELEDIGEAFDKLSETLAKSQKKFKKGPNLLSATQDWELIFQMATLADLDARPSKGKLAEDKAGSSDEITFTYHAPKSYSDKDPTPLVLIVPDAGEGSREHLEAAWADSALRDAAILVAVDVPGSADEWGGEKGVFPVMQAFRSAKFTFAVDLDRVFVAGHGKGFAAAAATSRAFPQLFAGLIGLGNVEDSDVTNYRSLPSAFVGGGEGAEAMGAAIGALGFENTTAMAPGAMADLAGWMTAQVRDPYPDHITFKPSFNFAKAAHWLSVGGFELDGEAMVDAVADRETNTITIDADKVSTVDISFNDALVDLEKPVRVVVNGTMHEEIVTRNPLLMFEQGYLGGDWGRVFTNQKSFDVPVKE